MNDSPALAQLRQTYSGLPLKGQKYAPVPLGLTLSLGSNHSLGLDSSCHLPKSPPVGSTADDGFMESRESAVENISENGKLTTELHPTKLRLQHSFPSFPIESNSPRQPLCNIDTESNNSIGITSDTLGNKNVLEEDSSCQDRPNIAGPRKKKPYKELTLEEKVELIRLAEKNTNLSQATIAEKYCIAKSNVCRILQRKSEYLSAYESAGFAGSRKRKLRSVGDQQVKENNSKTTEQAKKTMDNGGGNEDLEHKKSALENGTWEKENRDKND
ncbi:CENP-B DNA-binding domain protein [Ditylenchus destructor]|uniref:CENP-B DNA-binding domain protein n=1 Tax=Ditylenchus destructor TaxID=166010 RepID=A0AAD4RBI2_9BILA|nr:CENP-B DNA-binding domain protein [Ditylenchus destructor]